MPLLTPGYKHQFAVVVREEFLLCIKATLPQMIMVKCAQVSEVGFNKYLADTQPNCSKVLLDYWHMI